MAYSKDNLVVNDAYTDLWGQHNSWRYFSADPIATVRAAGYISNAKKMGLKVGNKVEVHDTVNNLYYLCYVVSINDTTGAGDITDGTQLSATNT